VQTNSGKMRQKEREKERANKETKWHAAYIDNNSESEENTRESECMFVRVYVIECVCVREREENCVYAVVVVVIVLASNCVAFNDLFSVLVQCTNKLA
jgi:hypothetical protein